MSGAELYRTEQETRKLMRRQFDQAKGNAVSCECGMTMPLRFAYRCLYCGVFFCQACAEIHFGKSRKQYNKERGKSA